MKKFLMAAALVFSYVAAICQECLVSLGSKTLYKPLQLHYSPVPKGYEPVFINLVNRHGARHLTKEVQTYFAFKVITSADSVGVLTDAGKRLFEMLKNFDKLEHPYIKNISDEGHHELQGIADRVYSQNKQLFVKPVKVNVRYTKEIRTGQSADVFLNELNGKTGGQLQTLSKSVDDTILRFFDLSAAYTEFESNGSWAPVLDSLSASVNIPAKSLAFANRLFTKLPKSLSSPGAQQKLATDIFGFGTIVSSLAEEARAQGLKTSDINFLSFFLCDEAAAFSLADGAEDYLLKGPSGNPKGIQVTVAAPLLADFINTIDNYISRQTVGAELRFAHAETIAPFAAILNLAGASEKCTNLSKLSACWDAASIIPLSSNVQFIVYANQKKDYLVKVLLNEKEARVNGVKPFLFPYYKWEDLKKFYVNMLNKINK